MSAPAHLYCVRLSCGCVLESRFGEYVVPEPGDPMRCPLAHGGMPQTVVSVEPLDDDKPEKESDYVWSE